VTKRSVEYAKHHKRVGKFLGVTSRDLHKSERMRRKPYQQKRAL